MKYSIIAIAAASLFGSALSVGCSGGEQNAQTGTNNLEQAEGELVLTLNHLAGEPESASLLSLIWTSPYEWAGEESYPDPELGYAAPVEKGATEVRIPWGDITPPTNSDNFACERSGDVESCESPEDCPCTGKGPQTAYGILWLNADPEGIADGDRLLADLLASDEDETREQWRLLGRPFLYFSYSEQGYEEIPDGADPFFSEWFPKGIKAGIYAYEPVDPERRFGGVQPVDAKQSYELRTCVNEDDFRDCGAMFSDFD